MHGVYLSFSISPLQIFYTLSFQVPTAFTIIIIDGHHRSFAGEDLVREQWPLHRSWVCKLPSVLTLVGPVFAR
ncbi:hypothetical protein BRADI_3g40666v3 [Brachypodium distachyon]|uniref:Uncharacterized protein n=1 Tax=Brachypodium distachyon TaxID=15368 RepID=A0A2K2D2E2_BRADI|nr:hypothetical protein BRADI_3g40666v3 [Brachypodium distachyon]